MERTYVNVDIMQAWAAVAARVFNCLSRVEQLIITHNSSFSLRQLLLRHYRHISHFSINIYLETNISSAENTETHGREVSECQFARYPSQFHPLITLFFFPRAAEWRFPFIRRRYGGDMSLRLGLGQLWGANALQSQRGFEPNTSLRWFRTNHVNEYYQCI